jgi:hypothetical protein
MSAQIAGRTDIQILEDAVGGKFTYDPIYDCFNLSLPTPISTPPLKWFINFMDYALIRMAAQGDDDDEAERLLQFFFGSSKRADETSLPSNSASWWPESHNWKSGPVADPQGCNHEYVEVTLFHFPSLRCRFCDVKKP